MVDIAFRHDLTATSHQSATLLLCCFYLSLKECESQACHYAETNARIAPQARTNWPSGSALVQQLLADALSSLNLCAVPSSCLCAFSLPGFICVRLTLQRWSGRRYDWGEYPMDTHFPVYGSFQEGLQQAVKTVQAAGVKCLPYMNARVFSLNETSTNGWDAGASQWSLKEMVAPLFQRRDALSDDLPHYTEEYEGLSGTHWAPMCPYTQYWQNRTAATAARLVGEAGMDGVYLDQVSVAIPGSNTCLIAATACRQDHQSDKCYVCKRAVLGG